MRLWWHRWLLRELRLRDFPPQQAREATETPRMRVLEDGLIMPSAVGLHDRHGQPIAGSWLERGAEGTADYPYGVPRPIDADAAMREAEEWASAVFLPYSDLQTFGHLLTEAAGWLGPLLDPETRPDCLGDPRTPIWMVDRSGGTLGIDRVARLLELSRERIRCCSSLSRPVYCRKVFLPVPSMVNRRWIGGHHFAAVRRLVDRFYELSEADRQRVLESARDATSVLKVYLSRSRLPAELRHLHGEAALEEELRGRGWRVVYPERLSIRDQLLTLAGARTIAGELGSALHLLMYFGRELSPKKVVALGVWHVGRDRRVMNFTAQCRMQQAIDFRYLGCLGFTKRGPGSGLAGKEPAELDRRFLVPPALIADRLDRIAGEASA